MLRRRAPRGQARGSPRHWSSNCRWRTSHRQVQRLVRTDANLTRIVPPTRPEPGLSTRATEGGGRGVDQPDSVGEATEASVLGSLDGHPLPRRGAARTARGDPAHGPDVRLVPRREDELPRGPGDGREGPGQLPPRPDRGAAGQGVPAPRRPLPGGRRDRPVARHRHGHPDQPEPARSRPGDRAGDPVGPRRSAQSWWPKPAISASASWIASSRKPTPNADPPAWGYGEAGCGGVASTRLRPLFLAW
jgi:hypothetical protein